MKAKAMGKDGKPLAGAAKTSFMKKCMHDSCEAKAVSADGKKLSGAAKSSFHEEVRSRRLISCDIQMQKGRPRGRPFRFVA